MDLEETILFTEVNNNLSLINNLGYFQNCDIISPYFNFTIDVSRSLYQIHRGENIVCLRVCFQKTGII